MYSLKNSNERFQYSASDVALACANEIKDLGAVFVSQVVFSLTLTELLDVKRTDGIIYFMNIYSHLR